MVFEAHVFREVDTYTVKERSRKSLMQLKDGREGLGQSVLAAVKVGQRRIQQLLSCTGHRFLRSLHEAVMSDREAAAGEGLLVKRFHRDSLRS